jgi:hypothetical protein
MMRRVAFILVAVLLALPALADGWGRYINPRYGYHLPLPPGFSVVVEAENSDGGTSSDGKADLSVWGANLLDTQFADEVAHRMASDEADGWALSYRNAKPTGASWSGTRDGRVLYMRAVPLCTDQAAFFRLEYPAAEVKEYDAVVKRMVDGFKGEGC